MDGVNYRNVTQVMRADAHADSAAPDRTASSNGLADEIDRLRQIMAETFIRERSFTADNVIRISKQLDVKINEYMIGRTKAR